MAKKKNAPGSEVQKWLDTIKSYEREFKTWEQRVEKILKRYKDERSQEVLDNAPKSFNILWSNVQTLVHATFARVPQPDVSRRFKDQDSVGRVAAMILERALDYEVQHYPDYRDTLYQSVLDRFLGGRGSAWARYEPHIKAQSLQTPPDGLEITEDVDEPNEELDYECAPVDYVHWRDFGHTVARTWEEVTAVWRKVYMTRDAMVARFGDKIGNAIPLEAQPDDLARTDMQNPELHNQKRGVVYEIWDKTKEEALWIGKGYRDVCDKREKPLDLEGFFPCPPPLYATLTNESLIPTPDFTLYQDQAQELDILADRIDGLIKSLQVKGVYDASLGVEIARIFTDATNTDLRPVKNWAAFAEKNGLRGSVDLFDLKPIADALEAAYAAMAQVRSQVYEVTGISDIVRGASEGPAKTATEQSIKGQYASLRLKGYQNQVALFATHLLRLKAQIVCTFDPQTLAKMAAVDQMRPEDQQFVQPALELLKDKPLRNFRVDIAADTLIQIDEQEEKQNRVEFLTAIGSYVAKVSEAAGAAPQVIPLFMQLLKFGVTGFKVGKQVEGEIDAAIDQLSQAAAQAPQQRPDPAMMKVQAEQASEQARLQHDQQVAGMEHQREMDRIQAEAASKQHQAQMQAQVDQHKATVEAQKEQFIEQARMDFERWQTIENNRTKIEVAEITAKAALDAAEAKAAAAASKDEAVADSKQPAIAAPAPKGPANAPANNAN